MITTPRPHLALDTGAAVPRNSPVVVPKISGRPDPAPKFPSVQDDLTARGLGAPVLCIIDGNAGLRRAVGLVWPRAAVQRCGVHKLRNLTRKAPKHALDEIRDAFHRIAYAASADAARVAYGAFERAWSKRCPGVVTSPRQGA